MSAEPIRVWKSFAPECGEHADTHSTRSTNGSLQGKRGGSRPKAENRSFGAWLAMLPRFVRHDVQGAIQPSQSLALWSKNGSGSLRQEDVCDELHRLVC